MPLALREIQPVSDEQALVGAIRGGDDRAFEELFSLYRRRISGYVYALVGDFGRAEDITQEVFISALRRLRETEQEIVFKPWIYEIARNACIDEFRRTRRAKVVPLDDELAEHALRAAALADNGSPELRWERKQRLHNLFGAFSGLSENHHQILVLRELEGLSYSEIADRMGISKVMVESTLFRARRRLTQEYAELDSGRRCQDVRAAVDGHGARALAALGVRERRRIAGHLGHCHDCLRYARLAGIDRDALQVPSVARRVAAVLPLGWLPAALRRARGTIASRHGRGLLGPGAVQKSAALSDGASPAVAFSRALAAAAALLALGGLPASSAHRQPGSAPAHVQPASPGAAPLVAWRHPPGRPAHEAAAGHRPALGAKHSGRAKHRGLTRRHPRRVKPPTRATGSSTAGPGTPSAHGGSLLPTPPGAPILPHTPGLPVVSGLLGAVAGQGGNSVLAKGSQAVNQAAAGIEQVAATTTQQAANIVQAATTGTQQAATTGLQQVAGVADAATSALSLPPAPPSSPGG